MTKDWAQELQGRDVTGRDILRLQEQVRRMAAMEAGPANRGGLIVTPGGNLISPPTVLAPEPPESRQQRRARQRREKKDAESRRKAEERRQIALNRRRPM